jgi:hypothetical protein
MKTPKLTKAQLATVLGDEALYHCQFCNVGGFTRRGLRVHWCKANPRRQEEATSRALSHEQWQKMVDSQDHAKRAQDGGAA